MAHFYEVLIADSRYHSDKPLTYESEQKLSKLELVSIPLRNRTANAFVLNEVKKPSFALKPIRSGSGQVLPGHSIKLAEWIADYYACSLGDALQLFAPSTLTAKSTKQALVVPGEATHLELDHSLSQEQKQAIKKIKQTTGHTVLLHGDTGSGKTRVYLELAKEALVSGRSVIILTPEIALTAQLEQAAKEYINSTIYTLHSQLTPSKRRKLWLQIAQDTEPSVVIGPRSAIFAPLRDPGLIILDEAHEPAYKQDQTPRYHAARVASQLASLADSKVVLGSATPLVADYFLASQHKAVVEMAASPERLKKFGVSKLLVDLSAKANLSDIPYISKELKSAITETLADGKQAMVYLNRRGSARQTLCQSCGWRLLCPRCDIPMIYHADIHQSACHTCDTRVEPPIACPVCASPDIIYKSAGTKAIAESLKNAFSQYRVARFDSDSQKGETVQELYKELKGGKIDILVGTQLLAKGLDLPNLGLVGVITADTSLNLPDYTASERTFQLLYQVSGRVGRGHGRGTVIVQTYAPTNQAIAAAIAKDWPSFYEATLKERQQFGYPPFVYMLKLVCRRSSQKAAKAAAQNLKIKLARANLPVTISGPTPAFASRRKDVYYWQLVIKSKQRQHLLDLSKQVGSDWSIDVDPADLL